MRKGEVCGCLKIVFVIIGTLVGAGFASGKEIYTFFMVDDKAVGIIRILISSCIIGLVIYKVLKICKDKEINTYQEFCGIIKNEKISNLLNNIVTIFLAVSYFARIAGFSSFMKQEFNMNKYLAGGIIVILCYLIFLKNISGLIKISDYLIPILIAFILIISTKDIYAVSQIKNSLIRHYEF